MKHPFSNSAPLLFLLSAAVATAQSSFTDDFDDGNDAGWTNSSPLQGLGVTGLFTFPDGNSYRIRTETPSPDPDSFGPARAGSFIASLVQTDFRIAVDLVNWDDFRTQDIGILARVSNPGAGMLNGYGFSYDNSSGQFFLTRIDGEVPTTLAQGGFTIFPPEPGFPAGPYRMTFQGFGPELLATITDPADPEFPVAELFAFDDTHTTGHPGLFNNGLGDEALTDATFDNFSADALPDTDTDQLPDPWERQFYNDLTGNADADTDRDNLTSAQEYAAGTDPTDPGSRFRAISLSVQADNLVLSFSPALPERTYSLQVTSDLATWTDAPEAQLSVDGGTGTLTLPVPASGPTAARVLVTAP